MSPQIPLVISGIIKDKDAVVVSGATVYIYDKDLDEGHSGYEDAFPELITNSSGEYQVDLGNFTGTATAGDEIWISAFYNNTAQSLKFTLSESADDKDLTLRNLEPAIAIIKLLRAKITDYNTTRDNTVTMIRPAYSHRELSKSNYPIITIKDEVEIANPTGICNASQSEERIIRLLITIYVWNKSNDTQSFTIGGVSYSGTKLRDYIARDICNILRDEFYQCPAYPKDAIIHKFYNYKKTNMESPEYNDERDFGIMKKTIEIELRTIDQA